MSRRFEGKLRSKRLVDVVIVDVEIASESGSLTNLPLAALGSPRSPPCWERRVSDLVSGRMSRQTLVWPGGLVRIRSLRV